MKALGFNSLRSRAYIPFQDIGFKLAQPAPLHCGLARIIGTEKKGLETVHRVLLVGRCKLDPGLKATGFKGST